MRIHINRFLFPTEKFIKPSEAKEDQVCNENAFFDKFMIIGRKMCEYGLRISKQ
jgi:hypothetical protein